MAREKVTVGIIGLGLMGGSASLKLREQGFTDRVLGHDINNVHEKEALDLGIIDEVTSINNICAEARLIILAIPVNKALLALPGIMEKVKPDTTVVDFGSTKLKITELARTLSNQQQFVPCHPIAGTENTGPKAAFSQLFQDKVNIICDQERSSQEAIEMAIKMTLALGMRTKFMDSKEHDRHIAYVSHLSHISSFMLGQTVLEVEKDEENIFDMAGSGFASTVRLAKSSPEMWAPIFTENANNILEVLDQYISNLNKFKALIEEANETEMNQTMTDINVIRNILDGQRMSELTENR